MVILDTMEKAAGVRILQTELNDRPGVCMKIVGALGDVRAAAAAAEGIAGQMQVGIVVDVIAAPDAGLPAAMLAQPDFHPLIEQSTVQVPRQRDRVNGKDGKEKRVTEQAGFAVGLIETQGFTAVFEAIDTALKTAAVEVLAREKLGGGYITVLIKGDVAAVTAAVEAGKAKVEGLGRLIAAHVIPSPSNGVLALLPKS
jgi:microcompartment protein CcmL/EutN